MKKILFLLTSPSPFGADLSILTNVNYLQKEKKIDPIFIIREKGKLEKYLKKKNIDTLLFHFIFGYPKKGFFLKALSNWFLTFY